jgi:dTMP kinase
MRGKFIVFEGVDGAGKTTQRELVAEALREAGIQVILTREPGGTPIAEKLREILLTMHDESISGTTEMLTVFAARAQHLDQVIRPWTEKGAWVLCDRFTASTFAYQVHARGLSRGLFDTLVQEVVGETRPDVTLFFDLPEDKAVARLMGRRGKIDRLDAESAEFFRKVRAGYREIAQRDGYIRIDADRSIEEVTASVLAHLLPRP